MAALTESGKSDFLLEVKSCPFIYMKIFSGFYSELGGSDLGKYIGSLLSSL